MPRPRRKGSPIQFRLPLDVDEFLRQWALTSGQTPAEIAKWIVIADIHAKQARTSPPADSFLATIVYVCNNCHYVTLDHHSTEASTHMATHHPWIRTRGWTRTRLHDIVTDPT